MTTDESKAHETIGAAGCAVTVEMGDDFVPGSRTVAALAELIDALHEEHGPETEGFSLDAPLQIRSFAVLVGAEPVIPSGVKYGDVTLKKGYIY